MAWRIPLFDTQFGAEELEAVQRPLKARWLGIYDGAGIHGTDDIGSLGSAASHGCIRMAVPDVIELYDEVAVQTPIYIA